MSFEKVLAVVRGASPYVKRASVNERHQNHELNASLYIPFEGLETSVSIWEAETCKVVDTVFDSDLARGTSLHVRLMCIVTPWEDMKSEPDYPWIRQRICFELIPGPGSIRKEEWQSIQEYYLRDLRERFLTGKLG